MARKLEQLVDECVADRQKRADEQAKDRKGGAA
jgi:hypothetical protein